MTFASLHFAGFFAIVACLTLATPRGARWAVLLAASYAFYAHWNAAYTALIAASTLIDFVVGRGIHRAKTPRRRKQWLACSVGANLTLLFTFKYWRFFHESAAALAGVVGVHYAPPTLNVLLPVGISFYTFQSLGYVIDVYRGREPERHLGRFALYISFFPQLVAGPIERASRLLPQLAAPTPASYARVCDGAQQMAWGLFKKTVVADRLGLYVDAVYGAVHHHNPTTLLVATYAFALQIYCDFSGYTDIAIGAARILGIDLSENFRRPYLAQSVTEFWRRWHITLSTWLRDYLYIPLGGNRGPAPATARNLFITMLIGGLWHGAAWTFVVWGALHGVVLILERRLPLHRAPSFLRWFVTFHLVCIGWVFFRAQTVADAWHVLRHIGVDGRPLLYVQSLAPGLVGAGILIVVELWQARFGSVRERVGTLPAPFRWLLWYGLATAIILLGNERGTAFIYFQF